MNTRMITKALGCVTQ